MWHKQKNIARLQFITSDNCALSHLEQIQLVLDNGIQWVQLRAKKLAPKELLKLAENAKDICDKYSAALIINDNHLVASMVNASGVHLGKEDIFPAEARKFLLEEIIGGTANTAEDVDRIKNHVDYIGLGPFHFTTTKEKLSPIVNIKSYREIVQQFPQLPIIAIGGIELRNIETLMSTGVHGIAVSGAIINTNEPKKKTKEFLKAIETYANTSI